MIVASAIKLVDGSVFVGKRHGDCFANIISINKKMGVDYEPARRLHFNCEQGFINDKLQFLNREQAYYEALACRQCEKQEYKPCELVGLEINVDNWKPQLASEDLW
jgi:hypothetical protein